MSRAQMSDPGETKHTSQDRERSPLVLWPVWIGWLFFLLPPLINLFKAHPPALRLIATLIGLAIFICIYLWATWRNALDLVAPSPPPQKPWVELWLPLVVLIALCMAITLVNGQDWIAMFYFVSGYSGSRLPPRKAIAMVFVLMVLGAITGLLIHASWSVILNFFLFIAIISVLITGVVRSVTTGWQLRAAREEIAQLAVTAERLRIARDLHDLLGHNLSLIALKSELAGRLLSVSPERTAREIQDIEQVARSTLQEVREAVATYRQPTLASELHAAQQILAAAGITYTYEGSDDALASLIPTIEAVLAWTVREGVTNVVKHSRARHCWVRLTREQSALRVEVVDDGTSSSPPAATANQGSGLRGLAERVETLGGQCIAARRGAHGFSLSVSLPLSQREATHA